MLSDRYHEHSLLVCVPVKPTSVCINVTEKKIKWIGNSKELSVTVLFRIIEPGNVVVVVFLVGTFVVIRFSIP